ncbi:SIS domain-containing protein [Alicyclobacillus fodiniaquatilis]|uniref:SIS domain-containing protein n=1 Tax=Alicyclobacillus fodiniaquatilis TaxID=1661150 RepID=A0ABW4JI49_9BACL
MDATFEEITNQPNSWAKTLEVMSEMWPSCGISLEAGNTHVLFIGCGTSFYLAQSAARLFQEVTGKVCLAVPASEIIFADTSIIPNDVPVVAFAISRSGTTSELLMAVEHLQKNYPYVETVAVTCHSDQMLAKISQTVISLDHASEKSVVMTQSFTNMLLALQWVAATSAGREDLLTELNQLPVILERDISKMMDFGRRIGANIDFKQYIFLGLGTYYGLATEATLKLKEMTQTPCESYNPFEFRHGPISIVENGTFVVFLVMRENISYTLDIIADVKEVHGQTIALIPDSISDNCGADFVLPLDGALTDWARSLLYMPALQYLAYARAKLLGLNPDQPRNLNQVVVLKSVSQ